MFSNTDSFNQPLDKWDTGEATSMYETFKNAKAFKNQDLSSWDVADVTDSDSHDDFMTGTGGGNTEPSFP